MTRGIVLLALAMIVSPAMAQEVERHPASKAQIVDCLSTMERNAKAIYLDSQGVPGAPGRGSAADCTSKIMLSMDPEQAKPFMDVVSLYTVAISNPSMISYTQFTGAAMTYAGGLK